MHSCLCLTYLVILCFGCGKPKLKLICCWKGRISQKPPKGLLGPRQLLIPHFENCLLDYPKVPKFRGLGEVPPGLKDLLKARFASHSPDISAGSLWSKALKGPYRGTMSGRPGSLRIAVIIGKQNKDDGVLCGYLVTLHHTEPTSVRQQAHASSRKGHTILPL